MKSILWKLKSAIVLATFHFIADAQTVGINTPNPLWPLDITGGHGVIRLTTNTSTYGSVLELRNLNGSAEYMGAINFNNSANSYPGQIGYLTNDNLTFRTSFYERMRIDENGNVGIGTNDPQYDLDIHGTESHLRLYSSNSTNGSTLTFQNPTSGAFSRGSIVFLTTGGGLGEIAYYNSHQMAFRVNGTNRLIVIDPGRTGISTYPSTNTLEVGGNASKTVAGDWLANSDSRLKKNIRKLDSQSMLEKILALEGVSYEWDDDQTGRTRPEGIHFGFIAQDIEKIFPTLVEEDNLGFLQTAYGTYDAMMVEAIRALDEKIKTLQSENEILKEHLNNIISLIENNNSSVSNHQDKQKSMSSPIPGCQ